MLAQEVFVNMGCAILEMFLRPGNISFGGTASGGMAAWLEGLITRLDDLVWGPSSRGTVYM